MMSATAALLDGTLPGDDTAAAGDIISKGENHHTLSPPARDKKAVLSERHEMRHKMSDDNEVSASSSLMDTTKATFLTGLALGGE